MLKKKILNESINKFITWHNSYGDLSYDRMDFWSSKPGILTKRLFYKNKYLGLPFAGLALLQETFFPSLLKLYADPRRETIGDAHYASAYLNLYESKGDQKYLKRAEEFLDALKSYACKGYSGYCWGYTFSWETHFGLWPSGTPLMTITPYAFWAFKKHFEITGNKESYDIFTSVAEFAAYDLNKSKMNEDITATSYSPIDNSQIINANTYRAAVLLETYQYVKKQDYLDEAQESLKFVLANQQEDGSWFYEAKESSETFIDNFHTCFVLRNLAMCYKVLKDEKTLDAIKKGYEFYRKNLIRENNTPIHFAKVKYVKLRKYEMYDYAEGIKLGIYLKDMIEGALDFSGVMAEDLISKFQLSKGYFITRVTSFGTKHKVPYHRWPQAQLFCSLAMLENELEK